MKSVLIITLYLVVWLSHAQVTSGIEISEFEIVSETGESVKLQESLDAVLSSFGQPDDLNAFYYEMDKEDGSLMVYGNDLLYEKSNRLYSFDIQSRSFKVGLNGHYIQIGDDINKLEGFFPHYENLLKENNIAIPFSFGDQLWDKALVIEFDSFNRRVSRIMEHER